MKAREGLAANDYSDPGPYRNPEGAHEVESYNQHSPTAAWKGR
jgi:hypothetical protein